MIFFLNIIGVFLLLCIHTKVVGGRLNLKKVVMSIILFHLFNITIYCFILNQLVFTFGSLLIYPTLFILYTLSISKLRSKVSLLLFLLIISHLDFGMSSEIFRLLYNF